MLGKILGAGFLIIVAVIVVISAYRNLASSWDWSFLGPSSSSTSFRPGGSYAPPLSSEPVPPPEGGGAQVYEEELSPSDIPDGFTLADLSPYFKKVRIGSVSPGYSGSYEQMSLYVYSGLEGSIKVSGWQLRSNKGSQTVPKAVNFYEPSGLSQEEDIYLENGHTLYMYSAVSPVGRNLRMNKCLGYLEDYLDFTPPLPQTCPVIDRSEISRFSGQCQDVLLSVGPCRLPPVNPPVPFNDYACRSFLDTLNYGGCVSRYRRDSDFLGKEWRVWYGTSDVLDNRHDRLLLFDENGKLVDVYSY